MLIRIRFLSAPESMKYTFHTDNNYNVNHKPTDSPDQERSVQDIPDACISINRMPIYHKE